MKYLFIAITSFALFSCGGEEESKDKKDSAMKDKVCECVTLIDQMRMEQKAAKGDLEEIDKIMKKNEEKLKECRKFEEEVKAMSEEEQKEIEKIARDCK